jgi:hypothetical protein
MGINIIQSNINHNGYQYHTEQYQDINLVKKNLGDGEELGFGMMYGVVICLRKKLFQGHSSGQSK